MPDDASEKPADAPAADAPAADAPAADAPATGAPAEREPAPEHDTATRADAGEASDAAPRKRKRKRKKAVTKATPDAPTEPALTPDGRERPLFVLAFPKDPELERLVRAFELGNYAYVREHAPKLAEKAESPRVRAAAEELARRIEPDPLIKLLLAFSVLLLFALAVWAYKTHGR